MELVLRSIAAASLLALPAAAQQPIVPQPVAFNPAAERLPPTQPQQPVLHQHVAQPLGLSRLADFEHTAQENHPQLAAAWNAVQVAEGKAWQARLYPNPQLGFASPQLAGRESQYNTFISQDFLTGHKLRLDQAAACQEVEQARLAMVRARFDVLTAVRRKFYETLAAQHRVAVQEELVRLAARSQEIGKALLEGKFGTKVDTLLLDVQLIEAQAALESAHAELEADKRQLAAAAGVPLAPIEKLEANLEAEFLKLEFDQVQQDAAFLNAQAGIAAAETERARILLRRAIVEPYPTFNVMGGYQHQLEGVREQGIMQITMSVPLWNRNQGGIHAAEAQIGRADAEYRRVQLTLSGQAAEALGRYRAALALVERYQQFILPKSRESVDLSQQLYREKQLDFLHLIAAQRKLNEVNLGYIDAQARRWDAAADLANLLQVEQFP
jgi:cobalt-zinc-cadmium efflux system outer membrane protein